ncbi:Alpha/Beta hydrolase protein [Pyrenochaeta sp. MPI-SDFR-AT-0127]|nr:Alpha/Beta hydrolase protein [Pyrenochaeta sp. MPI-SDFR-AT-0127]
MPSQTPCGTTEIDIPSFGRITGLLYPSETRQFCGVPYARLRKRWTRSSLNTSLSGGRHDGTQHGPICPPPTEFNGGEDPMVPVPWFRHFKSPIRDDLKCLNLNIVLPPGNHARPLPVLVWIHGGSFLFGSSTVPTYDMVNLVTYSNDIGQPIVGISINYRVGIFGFLASEAIKDDLSRDGLAGVGNFGLIDQQIALQWIQQYVATVGGDPGNVTIFGESAGGMSVAHQIWATKPAAFRRAISMSGTLNTIPAWPLEQHERRYQALLSHLKISRDPSTPDALEALRSIPQEAIAAATCAIEGSVFATGNPCDDGWFHARKPLVSEISSPPEWLQSYMIGDVKDEAMIFRGVLDDQDYGSICSHISRFMTVDQASEILSLYGLHSNLAHDQLEQRFEEMAGDGIFKIQTRIHARVSQVKQTYAYHVDQLSTLHNPLQGLAYHAIELLYIFMNMEEDMTQDQIQLSRAMAADFLSFAYGEAPWEIASNGKWMVYGPNSARRVKTEDEDEGVRKYGRMKRIQDMKVFPQWVEALDYIVNKRWLLGCSASEK